MDSQDVKRLTTTYPYVSQPNLHENSLAPPGGLFFPRPARREEKQKVLLKSGSFTPEISVVRCTQTPLCADLPYEPTLFFSLSQKVELITLCRCLDMLWTNRSEQA